MAYPTLRQVAIAAQTGKISTPTFTYSFTSTTLAGSLLISCSTCSNDVGHTISTVADPVNGNWTLVGQQVDPGNQSQAIFKVENALAVPSSDVITSTPGGSEDYQGGCLMELTGVPTSATIAGYIGANVSSSGSISTGTTAMGSANILLVGFFQNDGDGVGPPTHGSGFTSQGTGWTWDTGAQEFLVQTMQVANPGTIGATATASNGASTFVAQAIGILGVGGGPTPFSQSMLLGVF